MDGHPIQGLVAILCLTLFHAFVMAAKASLESVNEINVEKRAENGEKKAKRMLALLEHPHKYINLMKLITISFGIIIGMIFVSQQYYFLANAVQKNEKIKKFIPAAEVWMILVTIVVIYLVVLFGALLPKKLARRYSESMAYQLSGFLFLLTKIFAPIIWILEKSTNFLLRLMGVKLSGFEDNVTEDAIISIVNEGQEQGVLEAEEAEMISNIIEFDEKEANDIMTHRKKIIAVSTELSIEEALRFMLNESFSRFPLYQGNLDNIVGVLHLKDVINFYMKEELRNHPLIEAAREPYFIPDTQNIDVLFKDMQLKKIHMAIAIDEYGQTAGLVAMEDILEEIVGDIQDEYDEEEELIIPEIDGKYLIHGEADLEEVEEYTGLLFEEEDKENFDTINGFLISKLEHIPKENETEEILYCGYCFHIVEVQNKVIKLVRVFKISEETEDFIENKVQEELEENKLERFLNSRQHAKNAMVSAAELKKE